MTNEIVVAEPVHAPQHRQSFFEMEPEDQVKYASRIATELTKIIDRQKLFTNIQGRKYVKAEGWQTLGTFLGVIPRENRVTRLEDGSYEAYVDLIKMPSGTVIGGASALCSVGEKRWRDADEYARRSMAVTRAVGKSYRTAFSWIITLAGYEPTNAEEMPQQHYEEPQKIATKSAPEIYQGSTEQQERFKKALVHRNVPEQYWSTINERMIGLAIKELPRIITEVTAIQ